MTKRLALKKNTHPSDEADNPVFPFEKAIVEILPYAHSYNIGSCAFARLFPSIGDPDIGALMTWGVDLAAEAPFSPRLKPRPHSSLNAGSRPLLFSLAVNF